MKLEAPPDQLQQALVRLLGEVPFVRLVPPPERRPRLDSADPALRLLVLEVGRKGHWRLVTVTLPSGQPAALRAALARLELEVAKAERSYGVVLAPFVSERSAGLCRDAGVGSLDLTGNAELSFDAVFIKLRVPGNPLRARRELRSLFTPRAAQVLLALLAPPRRRWKVTDLAKAAGVSLGHVSNVRRRLVALEWGEAGDGGLEVTRPDELLEAWRDAQQARPPHRLEFYGPLAGPRLDEAVRRALLEAGEGRHARLASHSAAQWLAPYSRQGATFFHADPGGLEVLQRLLELKPVEGGGNVFVSLEERGELATQALQPAPGLWCTGLIQTWLDLSVAGERGVEAADHLLQQRWRPAWEGRS